MPKQQLTDKGQPLASASAPAASAPAASAPATQEWIHGACALQSPHELCKLIFYVCSMSLPHPPVECLCRMRLPPQHLPNLLQQGLRCSPAAAGPRLHHCNHMGSTASWQGCFLQATQVQGTRALLGFNWRTQNECMHLAPADHKLCPFCPPPHLLAEQASDVVVTMLRTCTAALAAAH